MAAQIRRKTPEELLRAVQAEEAEVTKGRLKVFLGYASGVGKSERMLLEAKRRYERGQNLVIAGMQPQVPDEVKEILHKIPVIATRNVAGVQVIDMESLLRLRPSACVIDGLAYDNPPGSRNRTRWEDARDLLDAGISVIGSINIQYIEELRAQVEPITGKPVSETIPLVFLKSADEIELVDAPIDQAGRDPKKLSKLREIALVAAADVVDHQLNEYLRAHGIDQNLGAQEKVMICITPRSNLRDMLEPGKAIADRFHGQLIVAYVQQAEMSAPDRQALNEKIEMAKEAGAQIAMLDGDDAVSAILQYAREQGITQLFIGHSQRRGLWARMWGNPVERLIRDSDGMDVRVFPQ